MSGEHTGIWVRCLLCSFSLWKKRLARRYLSFFGALFAGVDHRAAQRAARALGDRDRDSEAEVPWPGATHEGCGLFTLSRGKEFEVTVGDWSRKNWQEENDSYVAIPWPDV